MLSMSVILSSSPVDWDHLQVCSTENIPKQQELPLLKCVPYQEAAVVHIKWDLASWPQCGTTRRVDSTPELTPCGYWGLRWSLTGLSFSSTQPNFSPLLKEVRTCSQLLQSEELPKEKWSLSVLLEGHCPPLVLGHLQNNSRMCYLLKSQVILFWRSFYSLDLADLAPCAFLSWCFL